MSWFADNVTAISAIDGLVEFVIAGVVLVGVRRRLSRVPRIAALLAAYFLIEAALSFNRAFVSFDPSGTLSRAVVLEIAGTIVIAVALVNVRRIIEAVVFVVDQATYRASEYHRARHDYTQLVRHRINNPLAVIKGAAFTLESDQLDPATRETLRRSIIDAAEILEEISLAPEREGVEEHELDAIPRSRRP